MSTFKSRTNAFRFGVSHKTLLATSALTAAGLVALAGPAMADNWTDHQAVGGGSIDIDVSTPNTTNITQHGQMVKVQGDGDINAGWTVNVAQPSSSAKYVLYDVEGDRTVIAGSLNANGQVYIFDQDGTVFADGSTVNVGAIVTSTGFISDENIAAGNLKIEGVSGSGAIAIEEGATITVANAGLAAFVAPEVVNRGVVNAKMGTVAMAAGETVTLDMYGDGLFEVAVEGKLADALVENKGTIAAEGGNVNMTALAAKDTVDNIVNNEGVITVASAEVKGGKIVLSGGDQGKVNVSGALDASGKTGGGKVEIKGEAVVLNEDSAILADAGENGDGGQIDVYGDKVAIMAGYASARGGSESGKGGFVELSAGEGVGFNGLVDTSAANGESGTFLIDPQNINIGNYNPATTAAQLLVDAMFGNLGLLTVDQQALANTLYSSNVQLWASNSINTTADIDISEYDFNRWQQTGTKKIGPITIPVYGWVNYNGITANDLTLSAPTVNINHDVTLGTGSLFIYDLPEGTSPLGLGLIDAPTDILVDTLNLNGTIYARDSLSDPSFTDFASWNQIDGKAHTVNVLSNAALINQGIRFADGDLEDGAQVNLAADTFTENVIVDRALKLTGVDGTVIQYDADGPYATGTVLKVEADDVNIDPILFDGMGVAQYGVAMSNVDNVQVLGNSFQNFLSTNIYVGSSSNVLIEGNTTNGGLYGVFVYDGKDVKVNSNTINDAGHVGVYAEGVDGGGNGNLWIYNNDITNTSGTPAFFTDTIYGIFVKNSDGTGYVNDIDIWKNRVTMGANSTGIYVENSDYATIGAHENPFDGGLAGGNVVTGADNGIVVKGGANVAVRFNTVEDIAEDGIKIDGASDIIVFDNVVENAAEAGIHVTGGTTRGSLERNNITGPGSKGIYVDGSSVINVGAFSTADGNVIDGVETGVYVETSTDVKINSNTISDTTKGVYAQGIEGGAFGNFWVYNNDISNASAIGVHVVSSDGNNYINDIDIWKNRITSPDGSIGILVEGSNNATVGAYLNPYDSGLSGGNVVTGGLVGIRVTDSNNAYIIDNTVSDTDSNGIEMDWTGTITAIGNQISNVGGNGISAAFIYDTLNVLNNTISFAGNDGIGAFFFGHANIDGNKIAFTNDDGIDLGYGASTLVQNNVLGHIGYESWNADGIHIEDVGHTVVKYNAIADVLDDGIRVKNGAYVGIFGNNVLLTGDEGIEVSGVSFDPETMDPEILLADVDYPTTGYAVSIEDNEVVLAGDNGIYVHDSDSTRIVNNDVLFAGVGEAVSSYVYDIAALVNGDSFPSISVLDEEYEPSFSLYWSYGDGIKVENIHRQGEGNPQPVLAGVSEGPVYGYGDWTVLVQGNDVAWTGGDGIDVNNAGSTLIGGESEGEGNSVYQAGINWTGVEGYYNFADWVNSGPFADHEARRVVWWGQDLTDALEEHLVSALDGIEYKTQDGIVATNISNDGYYGPVGEIGGEEPTYYGYALNIIGNTVDTTGDDGIEAGWSSSALIKDNNVTNAGVGYGGGYYGYYGSFGAGDYYYGADGINAHNIYGENGGFPGYAGTSFQPYSLVIVGNYVNGAADDGIEVDSVNGRVGIYDNGVYNVGYDADEYGSYYGDYYYYGEYRSGSEGGDGIRVSNVFDEYGMYDIGFAGYGDYGYQGYIVNIIGNTVDNTGDDGIEVVNAQNVLIAENDITNAGGLYYGDYGYYGNGSDYYESHNSYSNGYDYNNSYSDYGTYGADGIHVRNVGGHGRPSGKQIGGYYGDGYADPYAVVIVDNNIGEFGYYGDGGYENARVQTQEDGYYGYYGVMGAADDGIEVDGAGRTLIGWNDIANVGQNSDHSSHNGYYASGSYQSNYNNYYRNGGDGIVVVEAGEGYYGHGEGYYGDGYYGYSVNIIGNTIDNAADDGIETIETGSVLIDGNTITNVGHNPDYYSYGSSYTYGDSVWYYENGYGSEGGDGIHVAYAHGGQHEGLDLDGEFTPYSVVIRNNSVDNAGDDGIEVEYAGRTLIDNNTITNVGENRDYSYDYDYAYAYGGYYGGYYLYYNSYYGTNGGDGIHVRGVRDHSGYYYGYESSELDGPVDLYNYDTGSVFITNNYINRTGDDGIEVVGSGITLIDSNEIYNVGFGGGSYYGNADYLGADGIHVRDVVSHAEYTDYGYYGYYESYGYGNEYDLYNYGTSVTITNNIIDITSDDGVQVLGSGNTLVDNNQISNIGNGYGDYGYYGYYGVDQWGADGVHVMPGYSDYGYYGGGDEKVASIFEGGGYYGHGPVSVVISNNTITDVADEGIETQDIDTLLIADNDITNVGDIGILVGGYFNGDVTLVGNVVTDAPVGAKFESGAIDISGPANSFINTQGDALPVGLLFDQIGEDNESLTIVGRTLGGTFFSGFQNSGSYYVYFTDGSILEPSDNSPILIDGTGANFDGVIPANTGGFITSAQRDFIEARLHDADDDVVNGRGQIFIGTVGGLDNVEDFFNQFGGFNPGISGLNLTITGLPRVAPFGLNLNNITPFAGGPQDIEPAAGEEGEEQQPQDVEPQAGGEEAACWGQALNAAVNGAVNYNFTSSPEEALSDLTECGVGEI